MSLDAASASALSLLRAGDASDRSRRSLLLQRVRNTGRMRLCCERMCPYSEERELLAM